MSKKNSLIGWFKKNILRMGDSTPTVDISKETLPIQEVKIEEEKIDLPPYQRPKKIKLVNNDLTVVMPDGKLYSKRNATEEDYRKVESAGSFEELLAVFNTQEKLEEIVEQKEVAVENKKKEVERQTIIQSFDSLTSYKNLFIISDGSVYLNKEGLTHRSIPKLLVDKFAALVVNMQEIKDELVVRKYEEAIETLVRFWEKCCLCPNAQSAEDLYGFLEKHKMKIDQHGNFYAYRRVVRLNNGTKLEKDLVDFISNAYNKVKAVWKDKPARFDVYKKGKEFKMTKSDKVKGQIKTIKLGNLEELYLSLSDMEGNRFTDKHTGQQDYRVGEIISMPRYKADSNNRVSCSKGYHVANPTYDYSSFGDTPILAIVNPMDCVSVPIGETGKMRVSRWFFAMTLDPKEEHILDDDRFDVRELGDIFEDKCLRDLDTHVKQIFTEEVKRHSFDLPEMTEEQVKATVKSLEEIKNDLRARVQKAV